MSEIQASKDGRVVDSGEHNLDDEKPTIENALERKSFFQAALPVFACGAGLFSDGYINNVGLILFSLCNLLFPPIANILIPL